MKKKHPLAPLLEKNSDVSDRIYKHAVMFAFTARSGSTVITDAIASMGLAKRVDEIFNPRGPAQCLYDNYGGSNIIDYINNIHKATMLTDTIIFKSNFSDLGCVINSYDIYSLFPHLKVVYIERQDKILQAVSAYKAIITNHWHQQCDFRAHG